MIANLDMNGYDSPFANGGYSPPEDMVSRDSDSTGAYPSPSSTVSGTQADAAVPVSHSSELAFALQGQPTQMVKAETPSYTAQADETPVDNSNLDTPFFYPSAGSYSHTPAPPFDSNEQQTSTPVENYNIYPSSGDVFSAEHQNSNQAIDSNLEFGHPQDVYAPFPENPTTATYALSYS